jgi:hypothetical protein
MKYTSGEISTAAHLLRPGRAGRAVGGAGGACARAPRCGVARGRRVPAARWGAGRCPVRSRAGHVGVYFLTLLTRP